MVDSVDTRLARIETKLDRVLEDGREVEGRLTAYEVRLRQLEQFEAKLFGIAAVVSIFISFVVQKWL